MRGFIEDMGLSSSTVAEVELPPTDPLDEALHLVIESQAISCPVCYDVFREAPRLLPCAHSVCLACLRRLAPQTPRGIRIFGIPFGGGPPEPVGGQCPLCQKQFLLVSEQHFPPNYAMQSVIDSVSALSNDVRFPVDGNCRYELHCLQKKCDMLSSEIKRLEKWNVKGWFRR